MQPIRSVHGTARWGYRARTCLTCQWQDERWHAGLLRRDQLVPIPRCPVHGQRVRDGLAALLPALPPGVAFPLRYYVQNDRQVTLVLKTAVAPDTGWLTTALAARLAKAGIEGLWLHLHPATGKKVFAKPGWHHLWGTPESRDENGMHYGPTGFQQLLPDLYRHSLAAAGHHLAPDGNSAVVDLYCGNGASLRWWTASGAEAIGVELGAEAVRYARRNVPGAEVLRGKCSQRIPQVDAWRRARPQRVPLLYANPPRTGLEPEVLAWLGTGIQPHRIAYLSCSAGTLKRDLTGLETSGYRVVQVRPYDFFPHTYHVETLVLLELG